MENSVTSFILCFSDILARRCGGTVALRRMRGMCGGTNEIPVRIKCNNIQNDSHSIVSCASAMNTLERSCCVNNRDTSPLKAGV